MTLAKNGGKNDGGKRMSYAIIDDPQSTNFLFSFSIALFLIRHFAQ